MSKSSLVSDDEAWTSEVENRERKMIFFFVSLFKQLCLFEKADSDTDADLERSQLLGREAIDGFVNKFVDGI